MRTLSSPPSVSAAKATHKSIKAKAPTRQTRSKSAVRSRGRSSSQPQRPNNKSAWICSTALKVQLIEELQAATGWQQHSVRGFLAGGVKKKLGLTLLSEKREAGPRRYRIASAV